MAADLILLCVLICSEHELIFWGKLVHLLPPSVEEDSHLFDIKGGSVHNFNGKRPYAMALFPGPSFGIPAETIRMV